ncbi:unnamed protein product [Peronospora belbahrii]|uniref:Chromatin modification-related protein EAF6 n=1 Tax=Peronospora belbahrii TaxID=622444 RepID=A0ABN8CX46_9STRA|nr:unnamed protein product [Peronospora belbahrii]
MEPTSVSNEMLTLYDAQRRTHEMILAIQSQIEEEEAVYLEETPHGNIIRGWDGFIDSKQPRKDANPKKIKPYTESEHLFSSCCLYKSMASEPSFDQVDLYGVNTRDENQTTRRKLTVTLSVGKGAGTAAGSISGVVDSVIPQGAILQGAIPSHGAIASHGAIPHGSMVNLMPKAIAKSITPVTTGKVVAGLSYQQSKASKLKKRKREAEVVASATAKLGQETVSTNMMTTGTLVTSGTGTGTAQPPSSDFLDVL